MRHPLEAITDNADAIRLRYGEWPSLHDAEIVAVTAECLPGRHVTLTLEGQIPWSYPGTPSDPLSALSCPLVGLRFNDVADVNLREFGTQNVIFDIEVEPATGASGGRHTVTFDMSVGFDLSLVSQPNAARHFPSPSIR